MPNNENGHIGDNISYSNGVTKRHPQSQRGSQKPETSHGANGSPSTARVAAAATHAALPSWATMLLMVTMIFGGCCSNVFALEAIIKDQPSAGPLITFAQFLLTALLTSPSFLSGRAGLRALFLAPRAIPLRSWLIYTAFFVSVNNLNNWAFAYKISVPLHIILRSGGPVASIIVGYLFNKKRYSPGQIAAVVLLTLGVVLAALADAAAKGQSINLTSASTSTDEDPVSLTTTTIGFSILALAMILSAFQGIYADRLYESHGREHWKEALFYSHALSVPLFLPAYPQIKSQWDSLFHSAPLRVGFLHMHTNDVAVPAGLAFLLLNISTQYLCIRGVHLLSATSSSLTVTIVLNVRKLVSLLLSIYLFGNQLSLGVLLGAVFVFGGGGLYGFEGARLRKRREKSVSKKE